MIIFVSYSSKNRDLVDQLADRFSEMGHTVLYDQKILVGQAWWNKILEDIRACDVFIYALSPEYLDSYPCDLEYRYARALNRHMLPLMIRAIDFGQVASDIALTNVLDYTEPDSNESLLKLVRVLNEISRRPLPLLPASLPAQPPAPISPLNVVIDKVTDSSISLTRQEQEALLANIRPFLYKPSTRRNARYALERFRKRSAFDLVASVADEIDSLLELSENDLTPLPATRFRQPSGPRPPISIGRTAGRIIAAAVLLLALAGGALLISQTGQQTGAPTPTATTQVASAPTSAPTAPSAPTRTLPPLTAAETPTLATTAAAKVLEGHDNRVTSVAFRPPDGLQLASGSDDATVRMWDAQSGDLKVTRQGHRSGVTSVAFSPDGSLLASGSADSTVWLWHKPLFDFKTALQGRSGAVSSVAFSRDGTLLASGGEDTTVRLWDVATHEVLATLEGHSGAVTSVAFSTDGTLLASGSADKTVRLWELATHEVLATLEGHRGAVTSVAFSPDGLLLASGSEDKTVRLWEVETYKVIATLEGHRGAVTSVVFCPVGSLLASGSEDKTVRLWDVQTRQAKAIFEGHTEMVLSVAFSPDGTLLASGSDDKTVRLWNVPTG